MKNKIILVLWISCLLLFDVGNGTLGKVRIQSDIVSLTVSSDGITKEDAIKNALRNAIEQAFGTFVSANTSILNDELIKDEIVTISKGNIISYKELSSVTMPDGRCFVTIKTNVSISKLADYATNKGAEVEFAGSAWIGLAGNAEKLQDGSGAVGIRRTTASGRRGGSLLHVCWMTVLVVHHEIKPYRLSGGEPFHGGGGAAPPGHRTRATVTSAREIWIR